MDSVSKTPCRRNSIADDWEDVADDNLSVVSLPGSEDDEPVVGLADLALEESTLSGGPVSETCTLPCKDDDNSDDPSPLYNGKGKETATKLESEESHGDRHHYPDDVSSSEPLAKCSTPGPLHEPSVSECLNFDPDEHQEDENDSSFESEDVDIDVLLRDIDSVRTILRDTIHSVDDLTTLHRATSEKARKLCGTLAMQVEDLAPIVAGYARAWKNTSIEIPLDPGLHSWLSGVRVKALALQVELQGEVERTLQGGNSISSPSSVLHLIWENLESCEQQMDDFLPIMQVDFNEFQTQEMRIPTAPVKFRSHPQTTAQASGRNTYLPPRPTEQVPLLRRELYRLRDLLVTAVKTLAPKSRFVSAEQQATDITGILQSILSTLSTMLSNHGSEWIEQGLSGGLTYAEFAQLDADCIRDFASQLENTLSSLDAARTDSYMRRQPVSNFSHEPTPAAVCAFDQLEVLVQVLCATFGVETK